MPAVDEHQLLPIAQARSGSAGAWQSIFQRYRLPLYAYLFELLRNEQTCLDVVQETFINAFRHIDTLRDDGKFGSWLFSIAHQKCVQRWRHADREAAMHEEIEHLSGDFGADDASELLIREEQETAVMKLIHELPSPQRSAILLHYLEGFSLEEIARITDAELGTVKSRLHYGKRALRKLLEEHSL